MVGMRTSVNVGLGHIASKVGLEIDDFETEEQQQDNQLVLKAIMENSGIDDRNAFQKRYAAIKKHIEGNMKRHKELVHQGSTGGSRGSAVFYHPYPQCRRIV